MPDLPVVFGADLKNPILVKLNKVPKRGSWFDLGDGTPAKAKDIRMIGGEPVIFAVKGSEEDKRRLKHRPART
jgi:hypothetical protein